METYLNLKRYRTTRRIVLGILILISAAVLIVFCALREKSKVVTEYPAPEIQDPMVEMAIRQITNQGNGPRQIVRYEKEYTAGIVIPAMILVFAIPFFIGDFLGTRIYYTVIDKEDVIIYNGLIGYVKLLVNGEERDYMSQSRRSMFYKGYMETKLKSGVRITVTAQFLNSYHISFSDHRPSIDI